MKFQLYLAIGGEHFDVQAFSTAVNAPNSVIKRIGERGHQIDPERFPVWDVWQSERIEGSNHPGDDVKALLRANMRATTIWRDSCWSAASKWVAVIGQYIEGESPRGFSFDANTVSSLAAVGCSIEIDMVLDKDELLKLAGG